MLFQETQVMELLFISGKNNQIIGNYIGTNASGTSAVANNYGIYLQDGNNSVGG